MAPVYLEEFTVCRPPDEWLVDFEKSIDNSHKFVAPEVACFSRKVFKLVGMSPTRTYLPPWINPERCGDKLSKGLDHADKEFSVSVLGTTQELLAKTGVSADDIDILVTACSVYCPTPSMSAKLVNKLGMNPDVITYSLGGMGCSSGVLGLQLTSELLQLYPGKRALFVCAEIVTSACYDGKDKRRYLANTLFRTGGAAALLSSRPGAHATANYRLVASARSHGAADTKAFEAVHFGPDEEGYNGLLLSKDLPKYAGKVLERCVRKIAPKIMTWRQYADAAAYCLEKGWRMYVDGNEKPGPLLGDYVPDFTRCIDHFALHAGGYVVVKAIQESMRLPSEKVMPSMASLMDFGNTSVSLTWYAWAYCEAVQHVTRGQRVLQMGVGSGVKGAVVTWEALRDIPLNNHSAWAHLNGMPYKDADLPRSIMEDPNTDAFMADATRR